MELWVAGFNAFNQLQFEGQLPDEPQDIHEFRPVVQNEAIEILGTSISATLVRTSSSVLIAGLADESLKSSTCMEGIAIAGNGKVSECKSGSVIQYNSVESYTEKDGEILGELGHFRCIVANQTTFTALSSDGKVWTWGDGRYEACIGRDATEESPATSPGIVEELDDLPTGPIVKISSGGYVTAALTEGSDLYIWGGRPGQPKLFDQLSGRPEPLDLGGHDFIDIAVGNDHIILLTTDHRVFVVGVGSNGQLGMIAEKLTEWTEISLPLNVGQRAVGVHAGYKTSLVLVKGTA